MKNLLRIKSSKSNFLFTILLIGLISFNIECTKDKGNSPKNNNSNNNSGQVKCDTVTFAYNAKVKEIINNNCSSCHSLGSNNGFLLDHTSLKNYASTGELVGRLKGSTGSLMPPSGKLSDCDISGIENWVNKGAPNN